MTRPTIPQLLPLLVPLLLPLLLIACFEDPVEETLHLELHAGGAVELVAISRISALYLDSPGDDPRVERRLRQEQQMLARGWDAWPLRFERAAPAEDSFTFHRQEGELVEVERWARLTDPDGVGRFFSDLLTAVYRPATATTPGELAFYAAWPARATGGERQHVERALAAWSAAVADHRRALAALAAHLDAHPDRARPCFHELFEDLLPDEDTALSDEEAALVAAVRRGMEAVTAGLLVQEGDVHTLNELVRKVHDPFPARVTVDVPGTVMAVEGFEEAGAGWAIPPLDLWGAFERLATSWTPPEPAVAWVGAHRADSRLDLDGWLATWRARERGSTPPPSPPEVRRSLEAELSPQPVYRLAWRAAPAG